MGILTNIEQSLELADHKVSIIDELDKMPTDTRFKGLNFNGVWRYTYRWDCPTILEPITKCYSGHTNDCFVAVEISIDISLNYRDPYNGKREALQTTLIYLVTKKEHRLNIFNYQTTGRGRADMQLFADNLFILQYYNLINPYFTDLRRFYNFIMESEPFEHRKLIIPDDYTKFFKDSPNF